MLTESFDDGEDNRPAVSQPIFTAPWRTLFLAILLPAFIAGTNQALFIAIGKDYRLSPCLYPWMIFTTALLSWCVGRYLQPRWLASIVFIWCLALLDFLTAGACQDHRIPVEIGYVLVSSQSTFAIVCAILGPWRWQWRLPVVLIGLAAVVIQSGSFMDNWNARPWNALMVLTSVVAVLVCCVMRIAHMKLSSVTTALTADSRPASFDYSQFSVKHLLFWATALVPLLLVARELDGRFMKVFKTGGWTEAAILIACLATIDLMALWATLGRRFVLLRIVFFLAVPYFLSTGLFLYSSSLAVSSKALWSAPPIVQHVLIDMCDLWTSWIWFAITLTAALLLFLRASGYQLARCPPAPLPA